MTPHFSRILKQHVQRGRLSQHTHTTVTSQTYSPDSRTWSISTSPPISDLPLIDYVYFATGVQCDFTALEMLKTITNKFPVKSYEGLPALNDNLMWHAAVPLFVTGRLATLRLGPGAGNLEGARTGAERVAWAIEDVLNRRHASPEGDVGGVDDNDQRYRYEVGIGSRFASLEQAEEQ